MNRTKINKIKYFSILLLVALCANLIAPSTCYAAQKQPVSKPQKTIQATSKKTSSQKSVVKTSKNIQKKELIEQKPQFVIPLVEDDVAKALDESIMPPLKTYKEELLKDENVVYSSHCYGKTNIHPIETELGQPVLLKPVAKTKTKILKIKIKTDKKHVEKYKITSPDLGEKIMFKVFEDVKKDNKVLIPKGSVVYGRVGELSTRAMGGAPAELVLEDFEIKTQDGKVLPLAGRIKTEGYSLSFWVGLAELATTPFIVGFAVPLLRFIPGGQAVISQRKQYVVYYQEK